MHARLKLRWLSEPMIIHCVKYSPQTFLEDQINANGFLQRVFSDETTFYISARINARNVKNRGYESLHALFVHLNPVCRRTIPVSMDAFFDSPIEGLLGNVFGIRSKITLSTEVWSGLSEPRRTLSLPLRCLYFEFLMQQIKKNKHKQIRYINKQKINFVGF